MKEQIVEFLSKGFSLTQVAQICQCAISTVAEIAEEHAGEIAANQAVVTLQRQEMDASMNNLEETILKRLETIIPFETSAPVLLRAFQILNAAKRRSEPELLPTQQSSTVNNTFIVMPSRFVQERDPTEGVVINGNGEIVEVEGRPLINASASSINTMLNQQVLQARLQQRQADLLAAAAGPQPGDF